MSIAHVTEHHTPGPARGSAFKRELETLINQYSREDVSDTPDFILASFMADCLDAFDHGVNERTRWYAHQLPESHMPIT